MQVNNLNHPDPRPSGNPNFPEDLDISPSLQSNSIQHFSDSSERDSQKNLAFGRTSQRDAIRKYGIAGRVWEAAYALNQYVDSSPNWEFDPPFVRDVSRGRKHVIIELGSGSGIVGSHIAKTLEPGRDLVIVTDLPEVCPLLEENLKGQIKHPRDSGCASDGIILVKPLAWGNSEHALHIASELLTCHLEERPSTNMLTHIVCSDLVYFPELLAPLLRTLIELSSPPWIPSSPSGTAEDDLTVIISYKIRSLAKETPFWSAFGLWFTFQPVLVKAKCLAEPGTEPSWQRFIPSSDGSTFVFVARRRIQSYVWNIPPNDRDLLDGVGAWGDDTRKGDDAFETLLLMTIHEEGEA